MMPLETGYTWAHGDLKFVGVSMAGISTSIAFVNADVCFDVAQGLPFAVGFNHLCITHGHMDHAAGLPYVLGQRAMRGLKAARIYMPKEFAPPFEQIMKIWSGVEDHQYPFDVQPVGPGDTCELKNNYFAKPFPTFHRIPSQGYLVFERKKRLLEQYRGLPQAELGRARHRGETIEEHYDDPVVAFTGDAISDFLDDERVRQARVLIMETTYFDDRKGVAEARQWGHIHLSELVPWLDKIESEKIVLIHTSARYSRREILKHMDEKIPAAHRDRVELFPRPD